jgi:hypothetical protein
MPNLFAVQVTDGKLHLILAQSRSAARSIAAQDYGQDVTAVWELQAKRVW